MMNFRNAVIAAVALILGSNAGYAATTITNKQAVEAYVLFWLANEYKQSGFNPTQLGTIESDLYRYTNSHANQDRDAATATTLIDAMNQALSSDNPLTIAICIAEGRKGINEVRNGIDAKKHDTSTETVLTEWRDALNKAKLKAKLNEAKLKSRPEDGAAAPMPDGDSPSPSTTEPLIATKPVLAPAPAPVHEGWLSWIKHQLGCKTR